MIIQSVDVIVASPGRNFVTLKIQTDDGLVGWGDATVNGRELSVVSYLRDHVVPLLLGGDAHRIEDTWQYLYRGAYWRRGPITMAAIAAVDMALWDLKAKAAGMPLYQLLGGRSRDRIRGYGHATGHDIPELLDSVRALVDEGYSAVRVQCGIPGLSTVYGIVDPNSTEPYEPARKSERPVEEEWDTPAYLRHIPRVFEAVRAEFGEELDLLHDAHHRLTPLEAARLGKSLEEYSPFWLEDVTPAENQEGLRLVRQHTTAPLAIGEVFNSVFDYQTLLSEQLIDYVRSSVTHAGGITAVRRLVDLAALSQVKSAFHGPTDISPIGMAAALHLDLAIHNFGLQEHMPHSETSYEAFPRDYRFEDGHYTLGDSPGLGVSLDESFAAKFEYQRAYLPVNRLKDGTIHDW